MTKQYVQACSAYLDEYTKKETSSKGTLFGWYHYIDSPDFHTVGVVATAQMLILIKDSNICVPFDCTPMLHHCWICKIPMAVGVIEAIF